MKFTNDQLFALARIGGFEQCYLATHNGKLYPGYVTVTPKSASCSFVFNPATNSDHFDQILYRFSMCMFPALALDALDKASKNPNISNVKEWRYHVLLNILVNIEGAYKADWSTDTENKEATCKHDDWITVYRGDYATGRRCKNEDCNYQEFF